MAERFYEDWVKSKTNDEIIKEIGTLRKNIKVKHQALQRQLYDNTELLEKQWKPVSEPLKKILEEHKEIKLEKNIINDRKRRHGQDLEDVKPPKQFIRAPEQGTKRKQKVNLPLRIDYESDYDYDDGTVGLPPAKRLGTTSRDNDANEMDYEENATDGQDIESTEEMQYEPQVYQSISSAENILKTPRGRNEAKHYVETLFTGNIARDYFLKLIRGGKMLDHNYGVRIDGDNWMIGDKKIEIDGNDIIINNVRYNGTRGLYELIFMNSPNAYIYTKEDLNTYAAILKDTNVYRVNFSEYGKKRSNKGYKYRNIIAPIINQGEATGSGINSKIARRDRNEHLIKDDIVDKNPMLTYSDLVLPSPGLSGIPLTDKEPEYIYFDDPNELVNRLRILYGSQEAGNNSHKSEINSIIEELLEMEEEGKLNT